METDDNCPKCNGPFVVEDYSTPIYQGFTERARRKTMKMFACEKCHYAKIVEEG